MTDVHDPLDVLLVTGPSGAGRTTAIRVLEDAGYEVIDNLPLSMLTRLLATAQHDPRPLALGLDVRNRDFSVAALMSRLQALRADPSVNARMLYLDCAADTLIARFSETRRRHPLAPHEDTEIGVQRELELVSDLADQADVIIDTTTLTVHDLKAEVLRWFDTDAALAISVQSFSYKRGLPRGLDLVFDLRFLANPHWVPELRARTGKDPDVRDHVLADPRFDGFFRRLTDLVQFTLPAYQEEGRTHLTIGLGCTGGKHRSVAVTELLGDTLAEAGWQVSKRHRELDRLLAQHGGEVTSKVTRPVADGGNAA
ncbi:nucleotide-binding protein [Jannaschia pagri]|uniref:Nucleotide-binding protein n=1 Tax=Jannaschia pagri TaxID=2829797 RepID=A0ABQ4NGW1_9RHOB|nr:MULTISPECIES: RNase adapter RapZ [unclassified Jannaschia]GIT90230.1 nucleotide-binding protein [Jannaschia sp. AI_61]GIT93664.1 nucleotide-binding protein [Jannaschia sp. AI_62]